MSENKKKKPYGAVKAPTGNCESDYAFLRRLLEEFDSVHNQKPDNLIPSMNAGKRPLFADASTQTDTSQKENSIFKGITSDASTKIDDNLKNGHATTTGSVYSKLTIKFQSRSGNVRTEIHTYSTKYELEKLIDSIRKYDRPSKFQVFAGDIRLQNGIAKVKLLNMLDNMLGKDILITNCPISLVSCNDSSSGSIITDKESQFKRQKIIDFGPFDRRNINKANSMGNSSKDTVAFDRKNINKANSMGNPTKDTAAFDRKNIGNVNSKGNPTKDKAIFDRKNIGNVNSKGNPTKDKATFDRKNNGNVNSKGNPTKDKATFDRKNIGNENSIPFAIHRIDKRFHNPMNVTKLARLRAILFEVLSDKSTEKTNFYPATPATEYLRWLKTANDILAHCVNNFVSEPLPYLLETLLGYGYMHEFGWKGCFEFFKIDKTLLQLKDSFGYKYLAHFAEFYELNNAWMEIWDVDFTSYSKGMTELFRQIGINVTVICNTDDDPSFILRILPQDRRESSDFTCLAFYWLAVEMSTSAILQRLNDNEAFEDHADFDQDTIDKMLAI